MAGIDERVRAYGAPRVTGPDTYRCAGVSVCTTCAAGSYAPSNGNCAICRVPYMSRRVHGMLLFTQRDFLIDSTDGALQGCRHACHARVAAQTPSPSAAVLRQDPLLTIHDARSTPGTMATGLRARVANVRREATLSQVSIRHFHRFNRDAVDVWDDSCIGRANLAGATTCTPCRPCCPDSIRRECPAGSTSDTSSCNVTAGHFSTDGGRTCSVCLAGNYSKQGGLPVLIRQFTTMRPIGPFHFLNLKFPVNLFALLITARKTIGRGNRVYSMQDVLFSVQNNWGLSRGKPIRLH